MIKRIVIVVMLGVVVLALLPTVGMAQEEVRSREPMLYGLASFIIPGFGQYLNNEPGKALTHFLIAAAILVACFTVTTYTLPYYVPRYSICGLASLGWAAYSAIDAYETAKKASRKLGLASNLLRW